ncbi:MAG: hypothetical protein KBS85_08380 [Lachnospiraceae bacterium]|nr:hypothetical protein [Candidatus Merdinaster equi]
MNLSGRNYYRKESGCLLPYCIASVCFFVFAVITFLGFASGCSVESIISDVNTNLELGEVIEISGEKNIELDETFADKYYYRILSSSDKQMYKEIYYIISEFMEEGVITGIDEQRIDNVFYSICFDFPELFYVNGYSYERCYVGGELRQITFIPAYLMDRDEAISNQALAKQVSDEWISEIMELVEAQMPGDAYSDMKESDKRDYLTAKAIFDTVVTRTVYVSDAVNNQNYLSVFLSGQSVCSGYAKAFQYLCQECGYEAAFVAGDVEDMDGGHAWVLLKTASGYYYVDPTWGDTYSGNPDEHSTDDKRYGVNYDYFMVTTEDILKKHQFDSRFEMPKCDAVTLNYYRAEHLYVADGIRIKDILKREKSDILRLRFERQKLFENGKDYLIDAGCAYEFFGTQKGVFYALNEDILSIVFWRE